MSVVVVSVVVVSVVVVSVVVVSVVVVSVSLVTVTLVGVLAPTLAVFSGVTVMVMRRLAPGARCALGRCPWWPSW
jgi:hypothetical protein